MIVRALVVTAVLLTVAPRLQGQEPDEARFAGCYDLQLGDFAEGAVNPGDSLVNRPPPRVELRIRNGAPVHPIHVPAGSIPSVHQFATWSSSGDTLRLDWTNGFMGLSAELSRSAVGTVGEAWPTTHTSLRGEPPPPRAPIVAKPVRCESQTPYPLSAMRRFRPRIRLVSGVTLTLGESLPVGLSSVPVGEALAIQDQGIGLASGAQAIHVTLSGSDLVDFIRLEFPATHDVSVLRDRLVERFGPPTSGDDSNGIRGWSWDGRAESIFLVDMPGVLAPSLTFHTRE